MSRLLTIARYTLGVALVVFGLNGFLNFIPMPPPPAAGGKFLGALVGTGYLMMLVKIIEIVVGVALLANRFVPLALIVLAPISVNIVLYHAVFDPAGGAGGFLVALLNIFLGYGNLAHYKSLLTARPG